MTKKEIILLADCVRDCGIDNDSTVVSAMVRFCNMTNPKFNEYRWRSYLRGECGPSGGKPKKEVAK